MAVTSGKRHSVSVVLWTSMLVEGCDIIVTRSGAGHDGSTLCLKNVQKHCNYFI